MTTLAGTPILHGYFRSSASYRVRIALNLKGVAFEQRFRSLPRGEQNDPAYMDLNPQGLVPTLEINGKVITQSLAMCEYLDEIYPDPPLLPADPAERAQVRAFAGVIACDVHPVQNVKILNRLRSLGLDEDQVTTWAAKTIGEGLSACEKLLADHSGRFCFGNRPSLADIALIPQLVNARRFGASLDCPRILRVEAACMALPAFAEAAPERQPDAA